MCSVQDTQSYGGMYSLREIHSNIMSSYEDAGSQEVNMDGCALDFLDTFGLLNKNTCLLPF